MPLSCPDMLLLAQHSNILGIKDSSGSLIYLEKILPSIASQATSFLGAGSLLFSALSLGARAGILALATVVPELCIKIYKLSLEKKWEEAKNLQMKLVPLNQALTQTYGLPAIKYALDLRGYHGGPCRLPLLPLKEEFKQRLQSLLKTLSLVWPKSSGPCTRL